MLALMLGHFLALLLAALEVYMFLMLAEVAERGVKELDVVVRHVGAGMLELGREVEENTSQLLIGASMGIQALAERIRPGATVDYVEAQFPQDM